MERQVFDVLQRRAVRHSDRNLHSNE
jgi:hypothetical protein